MDRDDQSTDSTDSIIRNADSILNSSPLESQNFDNPNDWNIRNELEKFEEKVRLGVAFREEEEDDNNNLKINIENKKGIQEVRHERSEEGIEGAVGGINCENDANLSLKDNSQDQDEGTLTEEKEEETDENGSIYEGLDTKEKEELKRTRMKQRHVAEVFKRRRITNEEEESRKAVQELAKYLELNDEESEENRKSNEEVTKHYIKSNIEHTNGKMEYLEENINYDKLKVIKAIDTGKLEGVRNSKELKHLKWSKIDGKMPEWFGWEYEEYIRSQEEELPEIPLPMEGENWDDDLEGAVGGIGYNPPVPDQNLIYDQQIQRAIREGREAIEGGNGQEEEEMIRVTVTRGRNYQRNRNRRQNQRLRRELGYNPNQQLTIDDYYSSNLEENAEESFVPTLENLVERPLNVQIEEEEDWDAEIERAEKAKRQHEIGKEIWQSKHQKWQKQKKENDWMRIKESEYNWCRRTDEERISENTRKLNEKIYDFNGKRWYARITRGIEFGELRSIPTDPNIDPPRNHCYNCWQPRHGRCRQPLRRRCQNCGRAGVDIINCERCADRYRMLRGENRRIDNRNKDESRNSRERYNNNDN